MNFGDALQSVFANYANFNGRARRSEFWYFMLFNTLVEAVLVWVMPLLFVYSMSVLVPILAVTVRRLHDTGKSGVYGLFYLIPLVGWIFLVIWLVEDSQPGPNLYGFCPKGYAQPPAVMSAPRASGSAGRESYLSVRCLSGPLHGQIYRVGSNGLSIGRELACTIRLPDGTPGISARHCEIRFQQGVPVLIDLGSHYGTYLADGRKLPPHYPEAVAAGTRFYLGSRNILFQITAM